MVKVVAFMTVEQSSICDNGSMNQRFQVLGNPIAHSLSPKIMQCFAAQFNMDIDYQKQLLTEANFKQHLDYFFANGGRGCNVTMPFKTRAYQYATVKSKNCQKVKAANTLWSKNNRIYADNTDIYGLTKVLQTHINLSADNKALIVGAGGSAMAVAAVLDSYGVELIIANRTLAKAEQIAALFSSKIHCSTLHNIPKANYQLIVNATSAFAKGENIKLPKYIVNKATFCYDLMYKINGQTYFELWAANLGAQTDNGLLMLVYQAAKSFSLWFDLEPNVDSTYQILKNER